MNTDTRQRIGEIDGRSVIDKGDKISVTYFSEGKEKTIQGIILSINDKEIEVNGTTPKKKILIENISLIKKISC